VVVPGHASARSRGPGPGVAPGLGAGLGQGLVGPFHDVERVGPADGAGAGAGHDRGDPLRAIGRHVGDRRAAFRAERVEESLQGGHVLARCGPHQSPGVVIDDHHQEQLPTPVGDLIDPDPAQPLEPVDQRVDVGPDPGDDRPDRAPRDPHQLGDRGLRRLRGQPRHLIVERVRMAGVVAGPGHVSDYHRVHRALHPHAVGLQPHLDRAQIQPAPPASPGTPLVIAAAPAPAASTPVPLPSRRPHRHDHDLRVLVVLDVLDDGLLDSQNRTP
jgi:hypothetical protein